MHNDRRKEKNAQTADQASSHDFSISLGGSREVIAEGCRGILSCSENQIKLNMGKRSAMVTGSDLVIANMFGMTVCIHGRIISVELM